MKKKILIGALCIVVLVGLIAFWLSGRNISIMQDFDSTTLSKTVIYRPNEEYITLTEQADIRRVIAVYQYMNLNKSLRIDKDGYTFSIKLYYKNGNISESVITGGYIVLDGSYYTCNRNYCDDFRAVYDALSSEG